MKLRPDDLRRTIQHNASRTRDYDTVSTRDGYDRWAAVYDEMDNALIALEERELPALLGDLHGLQAHQAGEFPSQLWYSPADFARFARQDYQMLYLRECRI